MSLSTCKCGKVFDSDNELEYDEKGNCCCDECFNNIIEQLEWDLSDAINDNFDVFDGLNIDNIVEIMADRGYRKIK